MGEVAPSCCPSERAVIEGLVRRISSGVQDQERSGSKELRQLARISSVNRICIAEMGAIPYLIGLLPSHDMETQTHAVTALLNLTLRNENNKEAILAVESGEQCIVEILNKATLEARENAAALVFSLSHSDANRARIGISDVFPGLVSVLMDGSSRGQKDAAAALYNLIQIRHNRSLAVRAGAVLPLLELAQDPSSGLVDESLTVLLKLASHHEGRFAIAHASGIPILVDLIRRGSPSNKEYAVSLLLLLSERDFTCSNTARCLGAYDLVLDLSGSGTDRARLKAAKLLKFLR